MENGKNGRKNECERKQIDSMDEEWINFKRDSIVREEEMELFSVRYV